MSHPAPLPLDAAPGVGSKRSRSDYNPLEDPSASKRSKPAEEENVKPLDAEDEEEEKEESTTHAPPRVVVGLDGTAFKVVPLTKALRALPLYSMLGTDEKEVHFPDNRRFNVVFPLLFQQQFAPLLSTHYMEPRADGTPHPPSAILSFYADYFYLRTYFGLPSSKQAVLNLLWEIGVTPHIHQLFDRLAFGFLRLKPAATFIRHESVAFSNDYMVIRKNIEEFFPSGTHPAVLGIRYHLDKATLVPAAMASGNLHLVQHVLETEQDALRTSNHLDLLHDAISSGNVQVLYALERTLSEAGSQKYLTDFLPAVNRGADAIWIRAFASGSLAMVRYLVGRSAISANFLWSWVHVPTVAEMQWLGKLYASALESHSPRYVADLCNEYPRLPTQHLTLEAIYALLRNPYKSPRGLVTEKDLKVQMHMLPKIMDRWSAGRDSLMFLLRDEELINRVCHLEILGFVRTQLKFTTPLSSNTISTLVCRFNNRIASEAHRSPRPKTQAEFFDVYHLLRRLFESSKWTDHSSWNPLSLDALVCKEATDVCKAKGGFRMEALKLRFHSGKGDLSGYLARMYGRAVEARNLLVVRQLDALVQLYIEEYDAHHKKLAESFTIVESNKKKTKGTKRKAATSTPETQTTIAAAPAPVPQGPSFDSQWATHFGFYGYIGSLIRSVCESVKEGESHKARDELVQIVLKRIRGMQDSLLIAKALEENNTDLVRLARSLGYSLNHTHLWAEVQSDEMARLLEEEEPRCPKPTHMTSLLAGELVQKYCNVSIRNPAERLETFLKHCPAITCIAEFVKALVYDGTESLDASRKLLGWALSQEKRFPHPWIRVPLLDFEALRHRLKSNRTHIGILLDFLLSKSPEFLAHWKAKIAKDQNAHQLVDQLIHFQNAHVICMLDLQPTPLCHLFMAQDEAFFSAAFGVTPRPEEVLSSKLANCMSGTSLRRATHMADEMRHKNYAKHWQIYLIALNQCQDSRNLLRLVHELGYPLTPKVMKAAVLKGRRKMVMDCLVNELKCPYDEKKLEEAVQQKRKTHKNDKKMERAYKNFKAAVVHKKAHEAHQDAWANRSTAAGFFGAPPVAQAEPMEIDPPPAPAPGPAPPAPPAAAAAEEGGGWVPDPAAL